MEDLTFGEQVKIILGRKGMTIKRLAELIEEETGKKMSRQNLTQRLGRDNFQEQDMRMIAGILGCSFQLSILSGDLQTPLKNAVQPEDIREDQMPRERQAEARKEQTEEQTERTEERDMTIGELYEIHRELSELEENKKTAEEDSFEPVVSHGDTEEDTEAGEVNPYTGHEYQSNSVRMHPTRIGYVQVYDRRLHRWTDMTEWAFLGLQERKKALFGKAYEPPIYLD